VQHRHPMSQQQSHGHVAHLALAKALYTEHAPIRILHMCACVGMLEQAQSVQGTLRLELCNVRLVCSC
jgi:hypothetical protein